MQAKIWKPDTYFNNVKDAEVHQVTMPNILLRIDKNGDILYSMRWDGRRFTLAPQTNFPLSFLLFFFRYSMIVSLASWSGEVVYCYGVAKMHVFLRLYD